MKNNRIVIVLLVIIIGILLVYGSYTTIELKKEPAQPHVEINYDSVDVKSIMQQIVFLKQFLKQMVK